MSIIIVFSIGSRIVVFEARNCREVTIPSVPGKERGNIAILHQVFLHTKKNEETGRSRLARRIH